HELQHRPLRRAGRLRQRHLGPERRRRRPLRHRRGLRLRGLRRRAHGLQQRLERAAGRARAGRAQPRQRRRRRAARGDRLPARRRHRVRRRPRLDRLRRGLGQLRPRLPDVPGGPAGRRERRCPGRGHGRGPAGALAPPLQGGLLERGGGPGAGRRDRDQAAGHRRPRAQGHLVRRADRLGLQRARPPDAGAAVRARAARRPDRRRRPRRAGRRRLRPADGYVRGPAGAAAAEGLRRRRAVRREGALRQPLAAGCCTLAHDPSLRGGNGPVGDVRERYRVAAEDTVSEHLAGPAERRLSARLGPAALLADLGAGAVVAAVALTIAVSMGTLVYGPTGAEGAARGVGLGLASAFALMLTVALAGTLRGAVAGAQDAPAAVVAGAVAPAAAGGALAAAADGGFATVAVMSGLTTLATGLVFVVMGWLRLGGLVRFLPYPVMGGFLAGTGWLLLLGGVSVMTDDYVDVFTIGSVLGSGWWYEVAPGLLLALCLLVVARRARTPLAFPLTVAAGVACFYLALALTGADLASWREAGLLLSGAGGGGMLRPLAPSELALADWQLVAAQLPALATVPALALVATLLNVTAAELNEPGRVDLDRQLRAAGFGNLAAGVGGGIVGYHVVSLTALNRRAGRGTNASVFVAAVLLLAALLFGGNAVGSLPRAVVGRVVSYLGLDFLDEWIATGWRRMAAVEYAIVVAILVAIALLGFLPGVALGLVLTVLLFVVSYGRVDPVRYAATGAEMRSRVRRSQAEQAALDAAADGLLVLQLQGFLLFGPPPRVLGRAAAAFRARAVGTVLLDLARVTGVDASGAMALLTLARRCEARGSRLWLAAVPPAVGAALSRAGAGAP